MSVQRVKQSHEPAIVTAGRVFGRWVSGRPLDGVPRSNSTFTKRGDKSMLAHRDHPSRWMSLPGWQRAAWRTGIALPTLANPVGLWFAPVATYAADASLTAGITAWGAWRVRRALETRTINKRWIKPLHYALCAEIGYGVSMRPADYLTIPRDLWSSSEAEMIVRFPREFSGSPQVKKSVERIVGEKLALSDIEPSWRLAGEAPYMIVRQAPRPPDKVPLGSSLDDGRVVLDILAGAPDSAPVMGVGHKGKIIAVDLDSDSPHVLLSISSGGGKSAMLRLIAMQELARGNQVVICDFKKVSHKWARGLAGVHYARTVEEIHDAIIAVYQEGMQRYDVIEAAEADDYVYEGPRLILLMEEMNATISKLNTYWAKIREPKEPRLSPAIEAFNDILFMGRQAKIHVIAVGQLMTAKALGGPEARECFSTRVLARYSVNAWKMLVPEVWPAPKKTRHPGRVQVVIAGEAFETQVIFATEKDAKEYVKTALGAGFRSSGAPVTRTAPAADAHSVSDVPASQGAVHLGHGGSTVLGRRSGHDLSAFAGSSAGFTPPDGTKPADLRLIKSPEQSFIGLREACESIIPDVSLQSARAARSRDPEFPESAEISATGEKLYRPDDLIRWARNRPRATGS